MSAPDCAITFCGSTVLPTDFDILPPFSSSVKPWVSTTSTGARPRVPQLSKSEDWNQPRCWSLPSRYITVSLPPSTLRLMPASPGKCTGSSSTKAWVEPESNQTSQMSSTFFHCSLASEPRKRSRAPSTYQASAPSCSKASAMRLLTASSCRISAEPSPFSRTNTAIGTPQARWREITQSGLLSIMPVMRFWPDGGTHCVTERTCAASAGDQCIEAARRAGPRPLPRRGGGGGGGGGGGIKPRMLPSLFPP